MVSRVSAEDADLLELVRSGFLRNVITAGDAISPRRCHECHRVCTYSLRPDESDDMKPKMVVEALVSQTDIIDYLLDNSDRFDETLKRQNLRSLGLGKAIYHRVFPDSDVLSIFPTTRLLDAFATMHISGRSCLGVVDEPRGCLVDVLSVSDLMDAVFDPEALCDTVQAYLNSRAAERRPLVVVHEDSISSTSSDACETKPSTTSSSSISKVRPSASSPRLIVSLASRFREAAKSVGVTTRTTSIPTRFARTRRNSRVPRPVPRRDAESAFVFVFTSTDRIHVYCVFRFPSFDRAMKLSSSSSRARHSSPRAEKSIKRDESLDERHARRPRAGGRRRAGGHRGTGVHLQSRAVENAQTRCARVSFREIFVTLTPRKPLARDRRDRARWTRCID